MLSRCDYCHGCMEEEDKTVPIFIGERETEHVITLEGRADKLEKVMGYNSVPDDFHGDAKELFDRRVDYLKAIENALKVPHVEVLEYPQVMEEQTDNIGMLGESSEKSVAVRYETNDEKVGIDIEVKIPVSREPDLEVCLVCAEELRGVNNE